MHLETVHFKLEYTFPLMTGSEKVLVDLRGTVILECGRCLNSLILFVLQFM